MNPPQNLQAGTLVLGEDRTGPYWTTQSPTAIHRAFGGSGDCPLRMVSQTGLTPQDGLWALQSPVTSTRGCPAAMSAMFASMASESIEARMLWQGAFHPDKVTAMIDTEGLGDFQWQEQSPNHWVAATVIESSCDGGICQTTSITPAMALVAPDRAAGYMLLEMTTRASDPNAAQLMAMMGAGNDCSLLFQYDARRTAN